MRVNFPCIVLLASLSAGCAILPEHVDVAYHPDPSIAHTRVAQPVDVTLTVSDSRHPESPDWIADKKNGYGMRLASVMAQKPVTEIVRDAFVQEFEARGIRVGTGPETIAIDITRLESVYQNRFFTIGAIGFADFAVQVHEPDGRILFAHNFSASNDEQGSLAGTAGQARMSVETAISKIVGQVTNDPAFTAAILTSRPMRAPIS